MVRVPPFGGAFWALPVGAQGGVGVGTVNLASVLERARGGQPGMSGAGGIPSSRPNRG
jgi:hypothetical protein